VVGKFRAEEGEAQLAFEQEFLTGEAADTISALLDSLGVSQRELANRLEVSEARVSQLVSGNGNLTLSTLATAGWALGVRFRLVPEEIEQKHATPASKDPPLPQWIKRMTTAVAGGTQRRAPKNRRRTAIRD
jgi:predicted XRE-type DNA-binding protein